MKPVATISFSCGLFALGLLVPVAAGQEKKADPQKALLVIKDEKSWGLHSAALSADGKRIATGHYDGYFRFGAVRVWDATTGEKLLEINAHEESPCDAVAFSPDGKRIVSGGSKKLVKVWDARTGKELLSLQDSGYVKNVAFSPDGKRIISGSKNEDNGRGTVKVWDADTGKELSDFKGGTDPRRTHPGVRATAVSPDGKQIAQAGHDNKVTIWDAHSGKENLKFRADGVTSIAFSADCKRIVAACPKGTLDSADSSVVKIWEVGTGKELLAVETPKGVMLRCAAFGPDGKWIVTGGIAMGKKPPALVKVLDAATGREVATFSPKSGDAFDGQVIHAAFTPDGNRIVVACASCTLHVFAFDKPSVKP